MNTKMQAIVLNNYGPPEVLNLAEVERPVPKENQVLIKIHAASVNAADWRMMRASPFLVRLMFGFFKPKIRILGADIAGRVEAVGSGVKGFKVGDEVFGDISVSGFGGFAEYVCAPETAVAHKPVNQSFEEAASVPLAAITALKSLVDKGKLQKGQKVLINGASGGVGTFAVQIAKAYGAEVTAVCSRGKMGLARLLGADHVIDYSQEDFTKNGNSYDIIIAANGYHPVWAYRRALKPNGVYVMVGGSGWQLFEAMVLGPVISLMSRKKVVTLTWQPTQDDLVAIRKLIEAEKLKPVIEKVYPLSEVREAVRYVEQGHARGKVVISI